MAPTCFGLRPSSGSLQLSPIKVILILKHLVKFGRNLLCGGVAACPSMACVLCAVQRESQNIQEGAAVLFSLRNILQISLTMTGPKCIDRQNICLEWQDMSSYSVTFLKMFD